MVGNQNQLEIRAYTKELVYNDLLEELRAAQALMSEVRNLSVGLQEIAQSLKTEKKHLRYEDLPDYIDVKTLGEYLRIGTNRAYEIANSRGFPKTVPYAGGKKIFAKSDIKEWEEKHRYKDREPKKLCSS